MENKVTKKWFEISADELQHRMELQQKYHDEPLTKAVAMLDEARDSVMRELGVDTNQPPEILQAQQEDLGIILTEEHRPEMAGLNGWFVFLKKKDDIIPFCWIGAAQLNSNGECSCEIHYFNDNRLKVMGGFKVIK
jgi:hypothetical protein